MPFFQKQKQIKNRRHSLFAPLQVRIPLSNVYAPDRNYEKLERGHYHGSPGQLDNVNRMQDLQLKRHFACHYFYFLLFAL